MKIAQFKLASGEEIISGYVLESRIDMFTLHNPLLVERITSNVIDAVGQVEGTQIYYTMKSWFLQQYDDNEVSDVACTIHSSQIMSMIPGRASVTDQYVATLKHLQKIHIDDEKIEEDIKENVVRLPDRLN